MPKRPVGIAGPVCFLSQLLAQLARVPGGPGRDVARSGQRRAQVGDGLLQAREEPRAAAAARDGLLHEREDGGERVAADGDPLALAAARLPDQAADLPGHLGAHRVRDVLIATGLHAPRVQAGLSGKQLADANGWAQSKVSRIENGQQMPSAEDIQAWGRTCNAGEEAVRELLRKREEARVAHATFRGRMRRGQARVQKSYNDLVRASHLIRHCETVYVPGLLQVPDYARRVLTEMVALHDLEIDDVDAAVEERLQRQQMLYDPDKRFEFLLAEPVLRWLLCPPAVMVPWPRNSPARRRGSLVATVTDSLTHEAE